MVGETIKLGFDGTSVKRGLANVMGGFSKLGRGIGRATRQVGIGAARRMGSDLFGMIVQMGKAIPNEIQNLSALNKEMLTMSQATGMATDNYLALREAIAKTTGLEADEATDFIRDVSERLGEAATDSESTPAKAARTLGLDPKVMTGYSPDEQLRFIGRAFKELKAKEGPEAAMFQINELLGEIGKKMIPLFQNYEGGMEDARKKTAGLHSDLKEMDETLESVFDIKSALRLKFSEISLGVLKALRAVNVEGKSLAEWISSIDMSKNMTGFAQMIKRNLDEIKDVGIFEWIKGKLSSLGEWLTKIISDAITAGITGAMDSIKSMMPDLSPEGMFKSLIGWKPATASTDGTGQTIANNTNETNRILNRIATNSVARYA